MGEVNWLLPENRINATPLLLLKQGLQKGQWEAVTMAYMILTGDKIVPPKDEYEPVELIQPPKEEKVVEISIPVVEDDILPEAYPLEVYEEELEEEGVHRRPGVSRIPSSSTQVNVKGQKNRFVDLLKDEVGDKIKYPDKVKIKHRPGHRMIECTCHNCHKTEQVDMLLAPKKLDKEYTTFYKCNDCSCSGSS